MKQDLGRALFFREKQKMDFLPDECSNKENSNLNTFIDSAHKKSTQDMVWYEQISPNPTFISLYRLFLFYFLALNYNN